MSAVVMMLLAGASHAAQPTLEVTAARQSLKNYGLAHCLAKQFANPSDLREDLGRAIGMYGVMGAGLHSILQNEDTLETLHNPYQATTEYIFSVYDQVSAYSKYSRGKIVFHACMTIYNSSEFDAFIETQDPYIQHQG